MAKNLIPEITELLGVELGEEFKIKDNTGTLDSIALNSVYAFVKQDSLEGVRLTVSTGEPRPLYIPPRPLKPIVLEVFELLCRGKCEVIRLPWRPKIYDTYWTFKAVHINVWRITDARWTNNPNDVAALKEGWVFRTMEEAKAALPKVAAEMNVEYIEEEA